MVKLFCALVGVAGSAFSVQKDESDSVDKLKDAIKKKKSGTIKGEADKLQLFLATTSDNAWLESDSEDVMNLKKGEQNIAIKAMTNEEKEIQGESRVQNVLVGMPEPSTDQIHLLVVIPEQKQAQIELWLATGFVENALTTKGIRSKLYTIAMHRIGYYDPVRRTQDKNVAFWYKGKKLCFHVLFKTKNWALLFETDVRTGPQTLGSPLYDHVVEMRVAQINAMSARLQHISIADYVPGEFDSPQDTVSSISLATGVLNLDTLTDEFNHQRIEHEKLFVPYGKAECCYLVSERQSRDHKREYAKYVCDPNNQLALSRDMHGWYAGMSAEFPIVNMLPGSVDKNLSIGNRRKVDVFVKVEDARCIDVVFCRLKEGSTKTNDPLVMKTFVHVEDPETFCFCTKWKHDYNNELWSRFFDLSQLTKAVKVADYAGSRFKDVAAYSQSLSASAVGINVRTLCMGDFDKHNEA